MKKPQDSITHSQPIGDSEERTAQQIAGVMGGSLIDGIMRLGTELGRPGYERWSHTSAPHNPKNPVGTFGEGYRQVYRYPEGVRLDRWPKYDGKLLDEVVVFSVENEEGEVRIATIGLASSGPAVGSEYNPGDPGEYILVVSGLNGENPSVRNLDEADMRARIAPGGPAKFGENPDRNRQIEIRGTVRNVEGYGARIQS
jgi:hypothetical protein